MLFLFLTCKSMLKTVSAKKKGFCKDPVKEECLGISTGMPKYSRSSYRLVLNFPSHFQSYPLWI